MIFLWRRILSPSLELFIFYPGFLLSSNTCMIFKTPYFSESAHRIVKTAGKPAGIQKDNGYEP